MTGAQFVLLGYSISIDEVKYGKTRPDVEIPIDILWADDEKSVTFGPYCDKELVDASSLESPDTVVLPSPIKCKVMCAFIVDLATKTVLAEITQKNANTTPSTRSAVTFSAPVISAPDITASIRMTVHR